MTRDPASAAERTNTVKAKRKIGDLGGVVEQDVRRVPKADLTLADQPLVLKNINIAPQPDTGEVARLCEDVLAAYSAVDFDFKAMTFSISAQCAGRCAGEAGAVTALRRSVASRGFNGAPEKAPLACCHRQ